jgi:hypothetical protein
MKKIALGLILSLAPCLNTGVRGQETATFRVEENIRSEPRGVVLGRVLEGVTLTVLSREDQWVEVEMGGWIWTASLQVTDRLGFDRVVSVSPRENLRREPSGEVMARLVEGTLLDRVEEVTGWTGIRRAVWVWAESVELAPGTVPSPLSPASSRPAPPGEERWWRSGDRSVPILSGPDGDTLASANPETDLRVLAREGNWIRVRLEGWSWAPEGEGTESAEAGSVLDLTPGEVAANPQGARGRTVTWDLQFVSLERAEMIRTDFYEGEPFLLTRTGSGVRVFVYVAVPPERVEEVEGLVPLERIRVVGRIRTGAAALTGNPILELLDFTRLGRE